MPRMWLRQRRSSDQPRTDIVFLAVPALAGAGTHGGLLSPVLARVERPKLIALSTSI